MHRRRRTYAPHVRYDYDAYEARLYEPPRKSPLAVAMEWLLNLVIVGVTVLLVLYVVLPMAREYLAGPAPTARPLPPARPVAPPQAPAAVEPPAPAQSVPAQPVEAPVVVVPRGEPRYAAQPQPTVWQPDATQTAAYNAVRGTPVPQVYGSDPTCNSANATYVTDPITVEKHGVPVGVAQGWSCESQAAAVAEAQARAMEMSK